MATATYTPTTSDSNIVNLWRFVQIGVVEAFGFGVPEWNWLQKLKNFDVDWSTREISMELDLDDDINVASIPEGGKEARPASPTAAKAVLTWILLNKRFTISKTAKYISQQQGTRPMLVDQLKWQSKKAVQSIRRRIGDYFYGFSSGTLFHAATSAGASSALVVDDLYGISGLGGTTANRRAVDLVRPSEYLGLDTAGTFDEIVQVSSIARSTNTITLASAAANIADGDLVTHAASVENTTAAGTDVGRALVGVLDQMTTASVHGFSSATNDRWDAALSNSDGGRFTGVKLRKLKQAINNNGGGTLDTVIWTQGVENDVFAQLQAGLRFSDSFGMEMDGSPKSKGVKFMTTKRVPDGYVFGWDSKRSIGKGTLLPEPGQQAFSDGKELIDDSGFIFSLDYPCFTATKSRANMGFYSGLTEQ